MSLYHQLASHRSQSTSDCFHYSSPLFDHHYVRVCACVCLFSGYIQFQFFNLTIAKLWQSRCFLPSSLTFPADLFLAPLSLLVSENDAGRLCQPANASACLSVCLPSVRVLLWSTRRCPHPLKVRAHPSCHLLRWSSSTPSAWSRCVRQPELEVDVLDVWEPDQSTQGLP